VSTLKLGGLRHQGRVRGCLGFGSAKGGGGGGGLRQRGRGGPSLTTATAARTPPTATLGRDGWDRHSAGEQNRLTLRRCSRVRVPLARDVARRVKVRRGWGSRGRRAGEQGRAPGKAQGGAQVDARWERASRGVVGCGLPDGHEQGCGASQVQGKVGVGGGEGRGGEERPRRVGLGGERAAASAAATRTLCKPPVVSEIAGTGLALHISLRLRRRAWLV